MSIKVLNDLKQHNNDLQQHTNDLQQHSMDIAELSNKIDEHTDILETINKREILLETDTPQTLENARLQNLAKVEIEGNMTVNLLGRDGDCENVSKWEVLQSTLLLDSVNKVFGSNGIKWTATLAGGWSTVKKSNVNLDTTKAYLFTAYLKNGTFASGVGLQFGGNTILITNSAVTDTTKFNRIGIKINVGQAKSGNTNLISVNNQAPAGTLVGDYAYVDGIMINEISQAEYNSLTVDELMAKYPYVNSAQPLQNPRVKIIKKNLFDGKLESGYWNAQGLPAVHASYIRTLNFIPVRPNIEYTWSRKDGLPFGDSTFAWFDSNFNRISAISSGSHGTTVTGTSPANCKYCKFHIMSTNLKLEVQLEEGSQATEYEPFQMKERIYPVMLSRIGVYQDKLVDENGVVKKEKRTEKKILDGSLSWENPTYYSGLKRVRIAWTQDFTDKVAIKYDGSLITGVNSDVPNSLFYISGYLYVTISNTDSGWGDSYTPTTDEIKAYFNGWKMYTASDPATLYNGTGTKAWCYRDDNGVWTGGQSGVLPVVQAPITKAWQPYQFYYPLTTPQIEEIIPYGEVLSTWEGVNNFVVDSGYVWEKANPRYFYGTSGYYHINNNNFLTNSLKENLLSKKVKNILGIYKNSVLDTQWSFVSDSAYGLMRANIEEGKFDLQAEYYVLYEVMQEEYNSQRFKANISYDDNLKNAHNELSETVSYMGKDLSQVQQSLINSVVKGNGERIESNFVDVTSSTSVSNVSVIITFNRAFKNIPKVIASSQQSIALGNKRVLIEANSVTTTGFVFTIGTTDSTNFAIAETRRYNYVAIGE